MKRFVEGYDRKQATLLPDCLDDFVAGDNPVRPRRGLCRQAVRGMELENEVVKALDAGERKSLEMLPDKLARSLLNRNEKRTSA
jgi:hypothetical protein